MTESSNVAIPKERDLVFFLSASMAGRIFASDSGTT